MQNIKLSVPKAYYCALGYNTMPIIHNNIKASIIACFMAIACPSVAVYPNKITKRAQHLAHFNKGCYGYSTLYNTYCASLFSAYTPMPCIKTIAQFSKLYNSGYLPAFIIAGNSINFYAFGNLQAYYSNLCNKYNWL